MFFRKAAIRSVPGYAVVETHHVEELEDFLAGDESTLQEKLDGGFRDLDRRQPALGAYLARELSGGVDELVQSLGYFLSVTVYLAFAEAFPKRLQELDDDAVRMASEMLAVDEELRAADPAEMLDSDDVVAMGQPALLSYIQFHVQEALDQADGEVDLEELDEVYRAILVEVIALSSAVQSPTGELGSKREALA